MQKINLTRQQKILLILGELSREEKKKFKFEDIAVALFKKFPEDFHLKGYKQYPDSGHSVRRPLYSLKAAGCVTANNMFFSLTDKGSSKAEKIRNQMKGKRILPNENFDRYVNKEIERIKTLRSFELYFQKKYQKILDTDFYDYLGVSVRSSKMEFLGRMNTLFDVAKALENRRSHVLFKSIYNFHNYMFKKFKDEIDYKLRKSHEDF